LDALNGDDWRSSALFDDREKLAIEWAEAVTLNRARRETALFERLTQAFSTQEVIELTLATAMFNMINRLNDSLQVDLEDQDQVDLIKRSVRLDNAALHAYVLRAAKQAELSADWGHRSVTP
jgi:hypothetical protein